jgi:two-component sensor histidine kinase/PAS domain-containing protein
VQKTFTDELGADSRRDLPIVIATMPATARQRKIAFGAFIVLVVIVAITIPFVNIQLARVDAFVPVIQTVMCVADLLTATFLFAQYTVYPQRAVLALASGFVFSGLFALVQTLAFPGAYAPAGLIGNGDNSAAWLFQFWHSTFPLAVIVYTLSKDARAAAASRSDPSTGVTIVVTIACVVTATAGLTLIATTLSGYLPSLFETATQQTPFSKRLSVPLSLLTVMALVLLFIRKRTILDYWLLVTLVAWLPTLIVGMLFTVLRFTVGWYSARVYALCAGSSLLFVLLAETMVLYTRLAQQQRKLSATVAALELSKLSLEEVNLWLNVALKNMAHGLSMFDKDQRLILCNERYTEMYGLAPEQTKPGTSLRSILNACVPFRGSRIDIDADIERRTQAIRNLQPMYAEYKLFDGRVLAMNLQPMPNGGSVAVHQDVTERERSDERQRLLMSELDHRVKNVLARVAAVAKSTNQGEPSEFAQALERRLQSMADAHALLSQRRWQGVSLAELVRGQLAPYTTKENAVMSGPDITLPAAATQGVAMVLQELVTNALKYGSLSTPRGQISVRWERRQCADSSERLVIAWRETGGPSTKVPGHFSYGTRLIRNLIPRELGGTVDLVFAPEGVRCNIEIPLETQLAN